MILNFKSWQGKSLFSDVIHQNIQARMMYVTVTYIVRSTSFIAQLAKKLSAFIQPKNSFLCSQKPASGSYTDPVQNGSYIHTL